MAVFSTLTTRVIRLLRQVPGASVQTYAEPLIEEFLNQAFRFVFTKNFWNEYTDTVTLALDGTTGVPSTNLRQNADHVITFGDILGVFPAGRDKPLPVLPKNMSPSALSGTTPMFVAPLNSAHAHYATRVFKVLPITATGNVDVIYRFRPKTTFTSNDEVYLDEDMLVYAAVYLYLKDDGSVPDMVDSYKEMFDVRYRDIVKAQQSNQPIHLRHKDVYSSRRGDLTDWSSV